MSAVGATTWRPARYRCPPRPVASSVSPKARRAAWRAFVALVHPDDRKALCSRPRGGTQGEPFDKELRIVDRRQDALDRARAEVEFDAGGRPCAQPRHHAGHHREKGTGSHLREQREFFRLISESIGEHIAVLDLQGRRLYNSPSYRQFFGDTSDLRWQRFVWRCPPR
jgi:PAS domain-containing protein